MVTFCFLSNIFLILSSCFVAVLHWDSSTLKDFLDHPLIVMRATPLLIFVAVNILRPLIPRFVSVQRAASQPAATPTNKEAWSMAIGTAVLDYLLVGLYFLYWNAALSGPLLCPLSVLGAVFSVPLLTTAKEEIGRIVWKKFISRAKLNLWPYTWELVLQTFFVHVPYYSFVFYTLVSAGLVDFPSEMIIRHSKNI